MSKSVRLARICGLIVGLIALALGLLAWFDSVRFAEEAGIAISAVDFGTLMAVKFIGNRNVSTGLVIVVLFLWQRNRALGAVLMLRGCIDLFDGVWLVLALTHDAANSGTVPTLVGASVLVLVNFGCGIVLERKYDV